MEAEENAFFDGDSLLQREQPCYLLRCPAFSLLRFAVFPVGRCNGSPVGVGIHAGEARHVDRN